MRVSAKTDYALRAAVELAAAPEGVPVKGEKLSTSQSIPLRFLENILLQLRHAGIVESRRGADGGYRLARPADQITVGQVLRFMEDGKKSKRAAPGPFTDVWKRVDAATAAIVDRTTFAELVRQWKESQRRYVPNWNI